MANSTSILRGISSLVLTITITTLISKSPILLLRGIMENIFITVVNHQALWALSNRQEHITYYSF